MLSRKVYMLTPRDAQHRRELGWLQLDERPDNIHWASWGIDRSRVASQQWVRPQDGSPEYYLIVVI
jgi:hypothetical protein